MAQSVARQWPGLPEATPESLALWARQITRLLQDGAIIAGLGPGDVVGPAGPVGDGNVVLFDGTTGLLLQDSGLPIGASGNRWGVIPFVDSAGVMEVGRYIDFHNSDADTDDRAVRLETNGGTNDLFVKGPTGADPLRRLVAAIESTLAQGDVIYFDGNNFVRLAPGTAGEVLQTLGAAANPSWVTRPTVVAAQATTSGTAFDFGGLPASVSRIAVNFNEVSLSGGDNILVQIGDAGGIEATGYLGAGNTNGSITGTASTVGWPIRMGAAGEVLSGIMTLSKIDVNTWVSSHAGKVTQAGIVVGGGSKVLSAGPLDRVRITRQGVTTFDAGSVNIIYD